MKLKLTNVSYTFNHFKLLHIEDEFKDFFEITYTRPGRMSAGMTCVLTVRFTPKINSDIVTKVPFLAHTGLFDVPLRCLTRKCVPSLSTDDLSLGTVILGDSISQKITISNDGALDTDFEIVDLDDGTGSAGGKAGGNRITFKGRKMVKGYTKVGDLENASTMCRTFSLSCAITLSHLITCPTDSRGVHICTYLRRGDRPPL